MNELEVRRWTVAAPRPPLSHRIAALLLRGASASLARLAQRLAEPRRVARVEPQLEYHADAGAPEGALYVDGQLVGWIEGVNRL